MDGIGIKEVLMFEELEAALAANKELCALLTKLNDDYTALCLKYVALTQSAPPSVGDELPPVVDPSFKLGANL
jgi:hypothetical protein